uniref:Ubiquitin-like protease family profile domain-containing protein n=1 Tax=Chenopodium quinoa TaxID=63459 RepID=A0A803N6D3_CHEQI
MKLMMLVVLQHLLFQRGEVDVEGNVCKGEGIPDVEKENKDVPKGDGDVPKGRVDVEGDAPKEEENKDVPTAEEELPKVLEAKASEGAADAAKGLDSVIPKSLEYCKATATYDSKDESETTNVQNKRHQLSRKQRKISEPLTLPVSYIINGDQRVFVVSGNEPTFFSCDGDYVKLTLCGHLIHNFGEYVRVAGRVYEKVWERQFPDRSRQFMTDPAFAAHTNTKKVKERVNLEVIKLVKSYTHYMYLTGSTRINVIFVPVLREHHWWCAAFSINRHEVLIIDSIWTTNAALRRKCKVDHLAAAIDLAFQNMDKDWRIGTICNWLRTSLNMKSQGDLNSCGIHMLIAIKRNADKLLSEMAEALPAHWRDLLSRYTTGVRVKRGKIRRAWHVTLLGADVPSTRSVFFDEG